MTAAHWPQRGKEGMDALAVVRHLCWRGPVLSFPTGPPWAAVLSSPVSRAELRSGCSPPAVLTCGSRPRLPRAPAAIPVPAARTEHASPCFGLKPSFPRSPPAPGKAGSHLPAGAGHRAQLCRLVRPTSLPHLQ